MQLRSTPIVAASAILGVALWVLFAISQVDPATADVRTRVTEKQTTATTPSAPAPGAPDGTVPTATCESFYVVNSPNGGPGANRLDGLAVIASNDVWAVGSYVEEGRAWSLTMHWDGNSWTVVPSPNGDDTVDGTYLTDVAALASNDVWAVGYTGGVGFTSNTMIIHWDGNSWTRVLADDAEYTGANLEAVTALAPNDVWAVGSHRKSGGFSRTLVEHWDGNTWSVVFSPSIGSTPQYNDGNNRLLGIDAVSANDIWAVGRVLHPGEDDVPIILHWDGAFWRLSSYPEALDTDTHLEDVAAVSANDVWAVGHRNTGLDRYTFAFHWNGSAWSEVDTPNDERFYSSYINAIDAVASNDIWAVGYSEGAVNSSEQATLILHWNGSAWSLVNSPPDSDNRRSLRDVDVVTASDVWAVGITTQSNHAIHWNGGGWAIVPTPGGGAGQSALFAVDALSTTDAWAVGSNNVSTLVEHWDGNTWSVVPSPNKEAGLSSLLGVSARTSNDVWAVGKHINWEGDHYTTLVEHWNGSQWSIIPSPNPGTAYNVLNAVLALAADDVWAVGTYYDKDPGSPPLALVLHWDGNTWTVRPGPTVEGSYGTELWAITATGPNDIWVAGMSRSTGTVEQALVARWNGSSWSIMPTANPGGVNRQHELRAISALSANDVWAVGSYSSSEYSDRQALIQHWNGASWTAYPLEGQPNWLSFPLMGVKAVAPNDVWAVGYSYGSLSGFRTLAAHWNGSQWSLQSEFEPDPNATNDFRNNYFMGIDATSANDIWAVGNYGGYPKTLVQHSEGLCSAGGCDMRFADVPHTNTFYNNIRCLACSGIISGYPCGGHGEPCNAASQPYFRYGNNITRGQISKIVSEAAGLEDAPGPQKFQDVPADSPFFTWINRLSGRGYISGYPCGGPGEPCLAPGNLPYFRPGAQASRGQLAKIVAEAAEYNDPASGQYFTDVPPDSTFYIWIQQLTSRSVMSGYACGGTGEPCDQQSRPYFRPSNNVTRGQASKIVANAFFPGCQTSSANKP